MSEVVQDPKPPTELSDVDRLTFENLHYKLLLAAYKEKSLIDELTKTRSEREMLNKQIQELNSDISTRYNINPETQEVLEGKIVPRGTGARGFQDLLTAVARKAG